MTTLHNKSKLVGFMFVLYKFITKLMFDNFKAKIKLVTGKSVILLELQIDLPIK